MASTLNLRFSWGEWIYAAVVLLLSVVNVRVTQAETLPDQSAIPVIFSHTISANKTRDGTATEQPVAIYSANACGLYGFVQTYMAHMGKTAPLGTVQLESRRHTVTLYARSTALLQVISQEPEPAGLR